MAPPEINVQELSILKLSQGKNNDALLVHGPLQDHEHWISQLPDLPEGIVVIDSSEN